MEKPFTITSFAWRQEIADKLRRAGLDSPNDQEIEASLLALAHFLEEHGLAVEPLVENGKLLGGEHFALRSSDLTEHGLAVLRGGFGKWEKKGCPSSDISPLEKAYRKVQKTSG